MKIHTRPKAHDDDVLAKGPAAPDADEAASIDSRRQAVRVVSISKSYGRHRRRFEALHDVTTSCP